MKKNPKLSSRYWRVRVHATQEEQIFDDWGHACMWADKVAHTFNDRTMKFDIVEVTEKTTVYKPEQ